MNNEEIYKVASELDIAFNFDDAPDFWAIHNGVGREELVAFYKAAYNKAIEDAAIECRSAAPTLDGSLCEEAIRELEME